MCLQCRRSAFTVPCSGIRVGFRRDKDIPGLVTRLPNTLGVVGSDALFEGDPAIVRQLAVHNVGRLAARFAVAARSREAPAIAQKLAAGEPLNWATSNPRQLKMAADRFGFGLAEIVCLGGGVEAALDDDPELDAVFDIVSSGRTMQAADLTIVRDNVGAIALLEICRARPGAA